MTEPLLIESHTKLVPVTDLRTHPDNPRRGHIDAIVDSIRTNGFYGAIVANQDGTVLVGNHRLRAAQQAGLQEVPVMFIDVDDVTARRILLVDNRTNDLAGYDDEALAQMLDQLPDLDGTGFNTDDLADLLDNLGRELSEPPEPIDPPTDPVTKTGDIIRLGPHILYCGDATNLDKVQAIAETDPPSLMWTDPPYGVSYVGKTKKALTIAGDHDTAAARAGLATAIEILKPGAPVYVCHPTGRLLKHFIDLFIDAGFEFRQELVWVKNQLVLGHSDYHFQHEGIMFGYKPGVGRLGRGGKNWHGDNTATTVFEVASPKVNDSHPTMKPVDLIEPMLRNSCAPGALVYDPFAGSGSTLLAADRLGRRCLAIELDPAYCDVIVDRWERHSGQAATRP